MAAPEQPLPPAARGCPSSASLSPPRGDRTLLVRHLPAELTAEEKEDLLKYFGAQSVRVLSDKGRLVRALAWGVRSRRGAPLFSLPVSRGPSGVRGGGSLGRGSAAGEARLEEGTWLSYEPILGPQDAPEGGCPSQAPNSRKQGRRTLKTLVHV